MQPFRNLEYGDSFPNYKYFPPYRKFSHQKVPKVNLSIVLESQGRMHFISSTIVNILSSQKQNNAFHVFYIDACLIIE